MKHIELNAKVFALVEKMKGELPSTVKLSNTSKLGVKSWSLQAINTCPASIGANGELVESELTDTNSTILPEYALSDYEGFICQAFYQEGKCLDCTACYDKDVKTVAYVGHGVSMKKNQSKKIAMVAI